MALEAAASKEPMKERPSGVDQAEVLSRTFDFDGLACVRCGGRRRLLATAGASLTQAPTPPQAAWC
ncbi:hypothetical protein ACN28E_40545 [Archangium lansingense]|uniref:hypothetical protein n=1 Tax=Archangium lansingense TaxID=2995310 RepID=UPI003B77F69E